MSLTPSTKRLFGIGELRQHLQRFFVALLMGQAHCGEATHVLNGLVGPWQLTIYSYWGIRMYHNDDYRQDWNAPNLPDGSYYYHIQASNQPTRKGWLEVVH